MKFLKFVPFAFALVMTACAPIQPVTAPTQSDVAFAQVVHGKCKDMAQHAVLIPKHQDLEKGKGNPNQANAANVAKCLYADASLSPKIGDTVKTGRGTQGEFMIIDVF